MNTSFESFWDTYDKKVGKDKAQTKWLLLNLETQEKAIKYLSRFIPANRNKQFRPDAAKYLHQRYWENEIIKDEVIEVYTPYDNAPAKSDYQPPEFNRNEWRLMVREKIERFFKEGEYTIQDFGNVIWQHLTDRGILKLTEEQKASIRYKVERQSEPRKNRFQEVYTGSIESDIKREELKVFLEGCKEQNRDILKELKIEKL